MQTKADYINNQFSNQGNNESSNLTVSEKRIEDEIDAINRFIAKGKYNIKKDIEEITALLLMSNTPITETEEGFCARNALASICERQEYISSLSDSYHIGTTIPSLVYLDFTYKRFREKIQVIMHNEKVAFSNNIYLLELNREKKAMKHYIHERLMPELLICKEEIVRLGLEGFILKYPHLHEISTKIDEVINQEVATWISKQ